MSADDIEPITTERLAAAVDEYDYEYFGFRIVDDLPADGEILDPSRVWVDGEPTDQFLPGTSAIQIDPNDVGKAIRRASSPRHFYIGRYALLLGSDRQPHSGADNSEIVMMKPLVLERWKWER